MPISVGQAVIRIRRLRSNYWSDLGSRRQFIELFLMSSWLARHELCRLTLSTFRPQDVDLAVGTPAATSAQMEQMPIILFTVCMAAKQGMGLRVTRLAGI